MKLYIIDICIFFARKFIDIGEWFNNKAQQLLDELKENTNAND